MPCKLCRESDEPDYTLATGEEVHQTCYDRMSDMLNDDRSNTAFLGLIDQHGAYELERRIQRRDVARKYYRRFPYDAWSSRTGMDSVDLVHPSDPLAEIIAQQSRLELLDGLTERELWVAERAEEGYKPRDMAALRGKDTSNADRWIKHSVKLKMGEHLAAIADASSF